MVEPSSTPPKTSTAPKTNIVALPQKAAEQRPSDKALAWVKKHPVLTVAGGLAVGAVVAGLLPRRAGRRLAGRAFELAELAATASMALGHDALDKAEDVGSGARRRAGVLAGQAERLGEAAADRVGRFGTAALGAAGSLAGSARGQAGRIGHVAADRASRLGTAALGTSHRLIGYPRRAPTFTDRLLDVVGAIRKRR